MLGCPACGFPPFAWSESDGRRHAQAHDDAKHGGRPTCSLKLVPATCSRCGERPTEWMASFNRRPAQPVCGPCEDPFMLEEEQRQAREGGRAATAAQSPQAARRAGRPVLRVIQGGRAD